METIKLHLGCGKRDFGSDWIHIDGGDFPHLKYHNVTQLPFKDNTVDVIYASHLIAYFDREEIKTVLTEWKRALKSGGVLRLATPDFEEMIRLYGIGKVKLNDLLGPLYGKWSMSDKAIYHKTVYDFDSLLEVLKDIGFGDIKWYRWEDTEHSHFDDHSQAYMAPKGDKENGTLISLNMEAIKK